MLGTFIDHRYWSARLLCKCDSPFPLGQDRKKKILIGESTTGKKSWESLLCTCFVRVPGGWRNEDTISPPNYCRCLLPAAVYSGRVLHGFLRRRPAAFHCRRRVLAFLLLRTARSHCCGGVGGKGSGSTAANIKTQRENQRFVCFKVGSNV